MRIGRRHRETTPFGGCGAARKRGITVGGGGFAVLMWGVGRGLRISTLSVVVISKKSKKKEKKTKRKKKEEKAEAGLGPSRGVFPDGQRAKDMEFRRGMRTVMVGSIRLFVIMLRCMEMQGQRLCGTLVVGLDLLGDVRGGQGMEDM